MKIIASLLVLFTVCRFHHSEALGLRGLSQADNEVSSSKDVGDLALMLLDLKQQIDEVQTSTNAEDVKAGLTKSELALEERKAEIAEAEAEAKAAASAKGTILSFVEKLKFQALYAQVAQLLSQIQLIRTIKKLSLPNLF